MQIGFPCPKYSGQKNTHESNLAPIENEGLQIDLGQSKHGLSSPKGQ